MALSPNVPELTKAKLCTMLGMANAGLTGKILGGADYYWANKEGSFRIYKRQGVEEIMRVESEISFASWERNPSKIGGTSHSVFCYECLPLAFLSKHGVGKYDEFFLVGQESEREERD